MGHNIKLRPFSATSEEAAKRSAYIGWSPVRLTVIGKNPTGKPNIVRLKSKSLTSGNTQLMFKENAAAVPADEISLDLGNECRATCFVFGKFQEGSLHNGASPEGKDVAVEAAWEDTPSKTDGSLAFMIRVRRDAQTLTDKARDDFTSALSKLNACGKGIYVTDFVAMHVEGADDSQHGDAHFLPWHRLYLLDLERLLQTINPAVTLPYWRFDQPAPRLFDEGFIGATDNIPFTDDAFLPGTSNGVMARFSNTNPLSNWKIGSSNGIERVAFFDTKTEPASRLPQFRVASEEATLELGGDRPNRFDFGFPVGNRRADLPTTFARLPSGFSRMEGMPHGAAHVSFNGPVNNVPTAPRDPLFFLLHCNVDRLWAKWQFATDKDLPTEYSTYPYQHKREVAFATPSHLIGLFPEDNTLRDALQWPWDDTWSKPLNLRPPGTRSRNFTKSFTGKEITEGIPTIGDALDAFGYHSPISNVPNTFTNYLGFSYDDVPFNHSRTTA